MTKSVIKDKDYISTDSEWSFEVLSAYDDAISKVAKEFKLDTYPNQIEVITAEQMMDAYSAVGMPLGYNHWSFGKQLLQVEKNYRRGYMGLAYELVINSNPCISYLMEENTLTMQALVIAHACYGHNSFFKGNYLFQTWTSADSIIDYLLFAKNYINECEEKYGIDEVEKLIDSCHALKSFGVDRYKRPQKITLQEEKNRQRKREEYLQSQINELWKTLPVKKNAATKTVDQKFIAHPEENILYFLEKNAPLLEPWQREIVRIIRKISQYFYPQRQTKVMNEGWATFWHYTLLNTLYGRGRLTDKFMVEFLHSHTNVIYQPPYHNPHYSGINPYTLGFAMFQDIRRICEHPTIEDKAWFPDIANSNWIETLDFAMRNFKDESFISQYLSPKVIRDLKLFSILDDEENMDILVTNIHDEPGYQEIRQLLSAQYNLTNIEPNIQVYDVAIKGNRALTLRYYPQDNRPLADDTLEVLRHLHRIWSFDVILETVDTNDNIIKTIKCPE